jgi:PKD repeat protein
MPVLVSFCNFVVLRYGYKNILVFLIAFTSYISTNAQLHADFTSNTQQGCSPLVIAFKDSSTGDPEQWLWDLGNGTVSTETNPNTIYFAPGTYTVKLFIRTATGIDSAIKTNYITVFEDPVVNFGATPTKGCTPLGVQFTD